jgi:hypothetical protein
MDDVRPTSMGVAKLNFRHVDIDTWLHKALLTVISPRTAESIKRSFTFSETVSGFIMYAPRRVRTKS